MTRIIETVAYQYNELSDAAKEKARDWFRSGNNDDNFWAEYVIDDAVRAAEILGIEIDKRAIALTAISSASGALEIYYSGFWSQGDGACFEGNYRYAKGAAKRIRQEYPQDTTLHKIADDLQAVQRKHFYRLEASCMQRGHYMHSGCMQVDVWHSEDRYRDIGDAESDVADALRAFADWIYSRLEEEWEYQNSDEVVAENILLNEYEFNEDGKRI